MQFKTPLIPATLIRRYKRFLSDVRLEDGTEIVAHCPNPGSMMGLKDEGIRVWVEPNNDPKKKLKYGLRLVEPVPDIVVGVDTSIPNRVIREALSAGLVSELSSYQTVTPEVKYGENSRIDFLLTEGGLPDTYVEVKSVTLSREPGLAEFPDSVTVRGTKHLNDLMNVAAKGGRAVMLYLIQRTDCDRFSLAGDIDPTSAAAFDRARAAGVEVLCYGSHITPQGVEIAGPVPIDPNPQTL